MPVSPEMSDGLRKSAKGRLSYDRDFRGEKINDVLNKICDDMMYTSIRDLDVLTPNRSAIRFRKSPPDNNSSHAIKKTPCNSPNSPKQMGMCVKACNTLNQLKSSTAGVLDKNIPLVDRAELCLQNFENERIQSVHQMFNRKREEFAQHEKQSFEKSLKSLEMIQGRRKLEEMLRLKDLAMKQIASESESEKRHQKLKEEHVSLAKLTDERLKEATLKDKIELEAAVKRTNEFKQKINSFIESKQNIFTTYQEIASLVKSCTNVNLLSQDVFQAVQSVNEMTNAIHKIVENIRGGKIDQVDVDLAQSLQERTTSCLHVIKAGVELVNKKIEDEAANITRQDVPPPPSYGSIPQQTSPDRNNQQRTPQKTATVDDTVSSLVPVASGSTKRYFTYMKLLEQTKEAYQELVTNTSLKKYKSDLQKAIMTPVNAISSQSGSHLMGRLHTLCELITGVHVEVGNRRVSTTEHPQGRAFCLDSLAKRLVRQGEELISSNHEAAFPIAVVAVGLWKMDPLFGELLLAQFFYKCSYLVPFYLARAKDQSEEEYHMALGYQISNGVLEEKDMFLKRLSGMVRLYAAILQSPLPKGFSPPQPYGVENCWILLSQLLNLEPLPDITATVLFNLLDVCGHALEVNYGKQFQKLLFLLCRDYFPQIQSVTPSDSGGPIGRLESFLQKCVKEGRIPPPPGMLPSHFWST